MSDTVEFGVDSSTESIFQKVISDLWLALIDFYTQEENFVTDPIFLPSPVQKSWSVFSPVKFPD